MKKTEQKTVEGQRNYGIDALRMLAMFMVVLLHVVGPGGVIWAETFSVQYELAWFLEIGVFCAVNCYALISGFVGIDAKYKISNLFWLWLRVAFYSILITIGAWLIKPGLVTKEDIIKSFFPVMTRPYWYFTSYFALFFFIPILNFVIIHMEKTQLKKTLIFICLFLSGVQTVFHLDVFSTENGYSVLWLIVLYLLGGYIKKYAMLRNCRAYILWLGYLLMIVVTLATKFILEKITYQRSGTPLYGDYLVNYMSPTILVAAVFLLLIFKDISLNGWSRKVVRVFSPLAFSVYLIHVHPVIWKQFILEKFVRYGEIQWWKELIYILVTALAIYMICSCIDLFRAWLFRKLLTFSKMFVKRQ